MRDSVHVVVRAHLEWPGFRQPSFEVPFWKAIAPLFHVCFERREDTIQKNTREAVQYLALKGCNPLKKKEVDELSHHVTLKFNVLTYCIVINRRKSNKIPQDEKHRFLNQPV